MGRDGMQHAALQTSPEKGDEYVDKVKQDRKRRSPEQFFGRLHAYARLLKLNVPELGLYPLIGFGILAADIREDHVFGRCLAFLLYSLCCSTLSIVLDDIEGYRDGVDQKNKLAEKRNIAKPLLTGELSLVDAWRAASMIIVLAVFIATILAWLSPTPVMSLGLLAVTMAGVVQYSWGLKLSYRGMGELVIIYGVAMTIALPVWLIRGHLDQTTLWIALLSGLPYAAQIVISNAIDYEGDKGSGRRTLTVIVGTHFAPWISTGFIVLFWLFFALGIAMHSLPPGAIAWLVLLPNHVRFLRWAFAGRPAEARLLSFRTIRLQLGVSCLSLAVASMASDHGH